ncbi:tripartite tricarboxylate transporter substrate-binding protein [Marinivivus vitaminiproducens]|uniref:tripartite tricarboxylate transporter substrate-binding protein n=1 Tax=Marinivivus vitaminiproducens TaxID=3035935 RepID=UPI0027A471BA|nr:tripartite tricarboxylate transporter substrate-binding protein [Geminicoccaceae bacterium SCSIO 64248]
MASFDRLSRRAILGGALAAGPLLAAPFVLPRRAAAQAYPERTFRVVIPTGQGGGAERLARAHDAAWSKLLGQNFEYEFFPGAGGQIGYEMFVNRREPDGYNLLFGNMGPEMIMYAVQEPDYTFPDDYIYFCRTDIDDSAVFVRRDSEYESIEQVVDAAKQNPLNTAVSRIPHPASIGMLALGEQTQSEFNLIPYGGGNPTQVAVLNGEADIGALPIAGIVALSDQFRVLGVFSDRNILADKTENAPTVNAVFGTSLPDLSSSRSWAVHTAWADSNPDAFAKLADTAKQALESDEFRAAYEKTGAPIETIAFGDRETCTTYAQNMIELANRYKSVLSADG